MAEEVKEKFELLTEIATDLSMQFDGINTDCRRKKVSTHYLAKLVHTCWSLTKLLPLSKEDFLDFPSIAAVCRNIIELTNLCWYYCIENVSELESEFRFLLYDFHDVTALNAIFNKLSFELDEPQKLYQEKEGLKSVIMKHQQFDILSEEDKKQVKKGRKATLLNHFQIIENRGINVDYFHGIYKLMSTHTHSTATSVNLVVNSRFNTSEMDEAFLDLTIDYTSGFIAEMILEIGIMWNIDFAKSESKKFIEFHASQLYSDI
ncbi:MAG: hypothetical protein COA66_10335 [Arcobacter sp.]|nr:MAG: hypothetical protein COA66_10335 [Arcobacter sp.]